MSGPEDGIVLFLVRIVGVVIDKVLAAILVGAWRGRKAVWRKANERDGFFPRAMGYLRWPLYILIAFSILMLAVAVVVILLAG